MDALLRREGLDSYQVGLLLFSIRHRRYLYERNIETPLIAASNTKLATTYGALKTLSPEHRWRTRFYRVEPQNDAGAQERQGLLVRGAADPSLTVRDLQRIALIIKSYGLDRLDSLCFDGELYDGETFPATWGDVKGGEPWFAPVSPFIVEKNIVEFVIGTDRSGEGFNVSTPEPVFHVESRLQRSDVLNPQVHVEQQWDHNGATFTLVGALPPSEDPYTFAAAVERPVVHFHALLRESLQRAGIGGEMTLRPLPDGPISITHLHTHISMPLREMLVQVNKESSNLAAEVLLRTMAQRDKRKGITTADGVKALQGVLSRAFPDSGDQVQLVDGSGLSRDDRMSPLFIVRLLHHVFQDFRVRAEFLNSLAVGGQDGTLQYRHYPYRMHGRLRAKSGTLQGVANLSGFLELPNDVVIFSFLINGADLPYLPLQQAQDRVVAGIYDALAVPGYPEAVLGENIHAGDVVRN